MSEKERIMLECRYLLSLNKNYHEIAVYLKENDDVVYDDLNVKLPKMDCVLYEKIKKVINNT